MLSNANTVLVVIFISNWSGYRYDKKASKRTLLFNHSAENAGRFNKKLLPKQALGDVKKVIQEFAKFTDERTLPYSGLTGTRILPTSDFMDFQAEVMEYQHELRAALNKLSDGYDDHIETAKEMLGDLFKASDYPDKAILQNKFGIRVTYMPVPVGENFNNIIGNKQVAELNMQIQDVTEAAIDTLMTNAFTALNRLRSSMLSDSDRYFKTTVVTNMSTIVNQMRKLEYLGAPLIKKLGTLVQAKLLDIDMKKLKASENYCNIIATDCKVCMDLINEYYEFS